jgi:glutamate racemase
MIGIFDSGFGGLTVFKEIKKALPQYDYLYLGDGLRSPYGGRTQEAVYSYTREAVDYLFKQGCPLVIIACNTSSSEALGKLQKEWLPECYPDRRILGVIRPVVEVASMASRHGRIGVLGTRATVSSGAYVTEIKKLNSQIKVFQNAAPLLVPLIEEGWFNRPETKMIIKKYLRPLKDQQIDTLILGCTHYPLLMKEFVRLAGKSIKVLDVAAIVAEKLVDYLKRHPEIDQQLTKNHQVKYLTTDDQKRFSDFGSNFLKEKIIAERILL